VLLLAAAAVAAGLNVSRRSNLANTHEVRVSPFPGPTATLLFSLLARYVPNVAKRSI